MSKTPVPFFSSCQRCKGSTRHQTLCESTESGNDEYHFHSSYAVIQCLGCLRKSFRYVFTDHENAYPISEDEWDVPEEIKCYPKYDPDHVEVDVGPIPRVVSEIYRESLLAIHEDALTLAGLGLRGTIEAICNDRQITGRNLEIRISRLATQGLISSKDAERLHAIRFLGNDAAHEIKKPTKEQISVALKIINHLIQSVYLLELEAAGKLDTIVTEPLELKKLLTEHLKTLNSGDELPLARILGKDIRRLGGGAAQLEGQLIAEINAGSFSALKVGKVAAVPGRNDPLQHFIVA